ncbi:hypothetical protein EBB79_03980 [Parasedimentitalea marina]|uniref:Uncharacterized protein n=1 Tax=Parasedimentitalea marina TaxID=2483033 RepID=A0A3T0MZG3_9RHOB|nr:hypothetical protein [Parasedimentitalea marina]AZV77132.1 hypothetical protein EBB79_03980 [Parasedimentitalea marina]
MKFYHHEIEQPFLIEPIMLARDLALFASIRFVSRTYPPAEPLNISTTADAVLDRGVEGLLLVDIWADPNGETNCGAAVFDIGREVMNLGGHKISGDWTGAGLLFLMIAMAQNVMGWNRYLVGVNELGGW